MKFANVTALSQLKVGDIFEFAQLIVPPNEPGVHAVRWQVDSIGALLCGIVMENAVAQVPARARFTTPPLMVASTMSVLHLPDWNQENHLD